MGQDLVHFFVICDGSINEGRVGYRVSGFQQSCIVPKVKEIHVPYLIVFMGILSSRVE